jgi:hypothetical protein
MFGAVITCRSQLPESHCCHFVSCVPFPVQALRDATKQQLAAQQAAVEEAALQALQAVESGKPPPSEAAKDATALERDEREYQALEHTVKVQLRLIDAEAGG